MSLAKENKELRAMLAEWVETMQYSAQVPGPDVAYERMLVDAMAHSGVRGFGAVMNSASRLWRKSLDVTGGPVGGEFVVGPCRSTVERMLAESRELLGGEVK